MGLLCYPADPAAGPELYFVDIL